MSKTEAKATLGKSADDCSCGLFEIGDARYDIFEASIAEIPSAEVAFFKDIVSGVLADQRGIDAHVDAALTQGWPLARVETVVRAILRAGTYELRKRKDVPARAIISEYVDLAAAFYDRDESGLINAVLDTLARDFRTEEFQPKAG